MEGSADDAEEKNEVYGPDGVQVESSSTSLTESVLHGSLLRSGWSSVVEPVL